MRSISFTYHGTIRGQGRPRFSHKLKRAYEAKADREAKKAIRKQYEDQTGNTKLSGEISMVIEVYRALPRSRPKKIVSEPDVYKPDADNIQKLIQDALNGIAYEDDRFITDIHTIKHPRKRRGEHAVITIREIER